MNRQLVNRIFILVVGVAAITLIAYATPGNPGTELALGADVTFDLNPEAGTYTASAQISDLGSGELISAPRITGKLGQEAVATSGIQTKSGNNDEIKLTFWADKNVATYQLEVIKNGQVYSRINSTLRQ